jgi:hypothetical protein
LLTISRLIITDPATTQLAYIPEACLDPQSWAIGFLVLFGTETPCNGLSTKDRIMFFAAAIGGRLYGKEQTQADA